MMKETVLAQNENIALLMDIYQIKNELNEINLHKGPASSDYISLSLKLDHLMKAYVNEKIDTLIKYPAS
jgi:hypothetical protein